jgi:histone H3/H4
MKDIAPDTGTRIESMVVDALSTEAERYINQIFEEKFLC